MSLALFSDLGRNLLVRTLIATAAVFLFLGFATGALPVRCLTQGLTSCGAVPSVPPINSNAAAPAAAQPAVVQMAAAEPLGPTLTDNEVVAATFAVLQPQLPVAATASTFRSTAASDDTPLATRTVKTVTIHADGTPNTGASAPEVPATQVAETSPATLPTVAPLVPTADEDAAAAIDAVAPAVVAKPQAVQKLALADEPPPPKPKKASAGGKSSVVTGQGANVHESSKNASKVLFALAGGSKVTVLDSNRGWIHITDGKGRSGWIYKQYLS